MLKITHEVPNATSIENLLAAVDDQNGFMVAVSPQLVFASLPPDSPFIVEAKDYPESVQAFLEKTDQAAAARGDDREASGILLTGIALRKRTSAEIKFRLGSFAVDESNDAYTNPDYYLLAKCPPGAKANPSDTIDSPEDLPDSF